MITLISLVLFFVLVGVVLLFVESEAWNNRDQSRSTYSNRE